LQAEASTTAAQAALGAASRVNPHLVVMLAWPSQMEGAVNAAETLQLEDRIRNSDAEAAATFLSLTR